MKKVFFLVNAIGDFDFAGLIEKHLPGCAAFAGTQLPPNTGEYDLVVLWSYRKKIDIPSGSRNIILFHSTNLPEGRGFAPVYNSIARGLARFTVSGIFAADEVDQGDLIVQASFPIRENYIAADLRRWDEEISLLLVDQILKRMEQGPLRGKKQEGEASWWPRRKPEDNAIDVSQPFEKLIPHLRACEEAHPAFFMLGGVKYLVHVKPENSAAFPDDMEIVFFDSAQ